MVGSALERKLRQGGFNNIVTRISVELVLINQHMVNVFFKIVMPAYVLLPAAK